jgi:hypothetical protein
MLHMLSQTLLLAALSAAPVAQANEATPKPEPAKVERARIQVFQLKQTDPEAAEQLLQKLLGLPSKQAPVPVLVPRAALPPAALPPLPLPNNPAVTPAMVGFVGLGELQAPSPAAPSAPVQAPICRVTTDPRSQSLVVRGTAKDLELAAELVAVLETPAKEALPETKRLRAFRLRHADPEDFVRILGDVGLDSPCRLAHYGRGKLLLAVGEKEDLAELADAVRDLDVPTPERD